MKKLFPLTQLTIVFLFFCATTFGQGIKGKVIDADIKEGIVGASVSIENSSYSTSTDLQGNYSLKVPKGDYKLVISFSGYEKKIIPIVVPATAIITMPDISLEEATGLSEDEILISVGTRSQTVRTKIESSVPIDIFTSQQLTAFGQTDLNSILHYLAPSFNANRQSGSDMADHIDPTSIRGMGSDQILVLVNGKRYHQYAQIGLFGTRGRGNNGTDLNTIPVSSVERIEILRDGAAAQYGSDAIAGVINVVLKSTTGFTGNINSGIHGAGDGLIMNANLNQGFKVGEKGFVNLTGEFLSKAKTFRPAPNDPLLTDFQRVKFGESSYENSSLYLNSEFGVGANSTFYLFGGINSRKGDSQGFTVDYESERNVLGLYPNGYEPRIGSSIFDGTVTAGFRTQLGKDIKFDLYNTFGSNNIQQYSLNTVNPSLGTKSPTDFDAGSYSLTQNVTGFTMSKYYDAVLDGLNVAIGGEHRVDAYGIKAGEEASWKVYPTTENLAGGSQNFPGINPKYATNGSKTRTNTSLYLDTELDVTKKFFISSALRSEYYSDFGWALGGKFATRYTFSDKFAVRGAINSGFRAPSLPQLFFGSALNDVVTDENTGVASYVEKLITPNSSQLTRAIGIPQLQPEIATNFSLGFSYQPTANLLFTIDGYSADAHGRIVLTSDFDANDPKFKNIFNDPNLQSAKFFANAIDTRSNGFDVTATYSAEIGKGRLSSSLGFNYNNLYIEEIDVPEGLEDYESNFLGARGQSLIVNSAPRTKFHMIFDYKKERFSANIRFNGFSGMQYIDYNETNEMPNTYDYRLTTDVSFGYEFSKSVRLNVGGNNIFNALPNRQFTGDTETGGMYEPVQMGFGGSYFYGRLNFNFGK
jgi:iron complex outermembrane recepter protein